MDYQETGMHNKYKFITVVVVVISDQVQIFLQLHCPVVYLIWDTSYSHDLFQQKFNLVNHALFIHSNVK